MKVSNIIPYFKEELHGITDAREITALAYLVIQYLFGLNRSDTIVYSNKVISIKESDCIKNGKNSGRTMSDFALKTIE